MKKTLLLLISTIFFLHSAFSQKEANVWYFGNFAGVDFNSGSAVAINNSVMSTAEGCAVTCDANGVLLFYTDGRTVWNSAHLQMPNGFGLLGDYSSSQSALIVHDPASVTSYYIFTTAAEGLGGLNYSVVDMTLQGGLGDVTTKNVALVTPVAEKLTGYQQTGSNSVWLVTHEWNTANFYSYLLSAGGVSAPVISNVGQIHAGFGGDNAIGWMKISPAGNKLAVALSRSENWELFDFDASTGVVSNPIVLPGPAGGLTYGVEFSQDGSLLYAAIFQNEIYQYDVTLGSAAAIIASQLLVGTAFGSEIGALQMAPDGKIYVAKNTGAPFIGVINNPAVAGGGCNYVDNGFDLSPNISIEGLPNFLPTYFSLSTVPVVNFTASDRHICPGSCISFTNLSSGATSYQWSFPGGNPSSSTDANPALICYDSSGTFDVILIATNAVGADTVTLTNLIEVYPQPVLPVITQVGNMLEATGGYASYQWYYVSDTIAGATDSFYVATQNGNYNLVVTDSNGCTVGVGILNVIVKENGVDELAGNMNFELYPNPSNEKIILSFVPLRTEDWEVRVFNSLGEEIYFSKEKSITGELTKEIPLKDFAEGIYIVQLKLKTEIINRKFIISK